MSARARWGSGVLGALAAATLSLSACSTVPPRIGEAPPVVQNDADEKAYQAILSRYSTHQELYEGFDTQLFSAATLQSWTFREARLKRQAEFLHWTPDVLAAQTAQERADDAKYVEYFFGALTNNPRFGDFDAKNSIWRIVLVTPQGQVLPSEVSRLGRADLNMRAYYPYMSDFWLAYRIRFPRTLANGQPTIPPDTRYVTLIVASTLGTAEFREPLQ